MKLTIDIQGLASARQLLQGFSQRRLNAVVSTALTRTARGLAAEWDGELFAQLDRPTAATLRAVGVESATAASLQAAVFIKDVPARGGAPSPAQWLLPQEAGGARYLKKFEQALIAQGSMPAGYRVVPGPYAKLDDYGNISRSQITQVIAQLGRDYSPGYARTISPRLEKRLATAKRRGRHYVAILSRSTGNRRPGVYQRSERDLLPVFFFVTRVQYHKRIDLIGIAQREAPGQLSDQANQALGEHIARLQGKGAQP